MRLLDIQDAIDRQGPVKAVPTTSLVQPMQVALQEASDMAVFQRFHRLAAVVQRSLKSALVSIEILPTTSVQLIVATASGERILEADSFPMAALCAVKGGPVIIADITALPTVHDQSILAGFPDVRTSLSAPIILEEPSVVGSITAWDHGSRSFTSADAELLADFAHIASGKLMLLKTASENRNREKLFQAIFDNAAVGISVVANNTTRIAVNRHLCDMLGYTQSELLDKGTSRIIVPEDRAEGTRMRGLIAAGEISSYQREARCVRKDGSTVWTRISCSSMVSQENAEACSITIFENIDEQKSSEGVRDLLLGEINHRVKNMLAIVQGIAKQLLRNVESPEDFCAGFELRIQSLAKSHDLLTEASWQPVPIDQIINDLLHGTWEPYRKQVEIDVASTQLNAQTTVMLRLLLNELLTNAVKHGALVTSSGSVNITSTVKVIEDTPWVSLNWREKAGRTINPPHRQGLGLYLIEKAPRLGLGGRGALEFMTDGIDYHVEFPAYPDRKIFNRSLKTTC